MRGVVKTQSWTLVINHIIQHTNTADFFATAAASCRWMLLWLIGGRVVGSIIGCCCYSFRGLFDQLWASSKCCTKTNSTYIAHSLVCAPESISTLIC